MGDLRQVRQLNIIEIYKDVPYALSQDYSYTKGEMKNIEIIRGRVGKTINFTIEGIAFQVESSDIKIDEVKEGNLYKVIYLPNSKYIIEIERYD